MPYGDPLVPGNVSKLFDSPINRDIIALFASSFGLLASGDFNHSIYSFFDAIKSCENIILLRVILRTL
jgi:hypothetical protein